MDVRSIRGTHDILPGSVELWQRIEQTARSLFGRYGFSEIRTPVFEETELFARSIGAETDIVQKEMYTFSDTRGKGITLRPEGTAPVVRSYIEHSLYARGEAVKLFYVGPMFRRERPQKGRYRQFHQIGCEVLGTDNPAVEAEVLDMLRSFLGSLGLTDYQLLVNSVGCPRCRPGYVRDVLQPRLREQLDRLCEQCQRRTETNPLRVLDCKVPECQPVIEQLPKMTDHLCEECRSHHQRFLGYLELLDIPSREEPRLVRGLDYYVRTTFEIISDRLGPTQNALLGGGRYDGLSEALGGPPSQGFGFALGLERFVLLLSGSDTLDRPFEPQAPEVFLCWFDETTLRESLRLAHELRDAEVSVGLDYSTRSLKAQLRQANRVNASYVIVVGEQEIRDQRFSLKKMSDGSQVVLHRDELPSYFLQGLNRAG